MVEAHMKPPSPPPPPSICADAARLAAGRTAANWNPLTTERKHTTRLAIIATATRGRAATDEARWGYVPTEPHTQSIPVVSTGAGVGLARARSTLNTV